MKKDEERTKVMGGREKIKKEIRRKSTHTHRQHTATYQINNLTTQTSREVATALSTKDSPLRMVKQL